MDNYNRKEARINAHRKVYEAHIAAIRAIIPVIEGMDGKILDKRFKTAMDNAVEGYYFNYITNYGELYIEGYNSKDRMYRVEGKEGCYYVSNDSFTCRAGKYEDVFTTTDSGKWRINAAPIIAKLEECIAYHEKQINDMNTAIKSGDTIAAELQEIAEKLREFNHKYSYEVRDILGLIYNLEYRGSSSTKDYSIKTW